MFKEYIHNKNFPLWLLTISVVIILTVPTLIQDGMFLDGMLYTCISHNLSKGIGTFWFPQFSPSYFNSGSQVFHEHPPLVFGIQSIFFRLLGDSMYVERLYIFITMCVSAFSIHFLWRLLFRKDQDLKSISWLPVLLWITIPSSSWSYSNNMMENTMGMFSLIAVFFIYKALDYEKNEYLNLFISGIFIFLATMSKGVPGLFPVSIPFLHWIIFRKKSLKRTVFQTSIIVSVPLLVYVILFNLPQSQESLYFYLTKRLFGRIINDPTVGNRFYILKRLLNELLPLIILTIIIFSIKRLKKSHEPLLIKSPQSVFFLLTGLAASSPMILTMVQRGFYLVPSFPYFAIGFAIILAPMAFKVKEKSFANIRVFKICRMLSFCLLIFTIGFSLMKIGKTSRDVNMLHDVHAIGKAIPAKSEVTVNRDIANTYVLECYFIRYYNISLFIDVPKNYLIVKKLSSQVISPGFNKLNIDTKIYDVYVKEKQNK